MFVVVYGMTILGFLAHLIRVEVDVANGQPSFDIDVGSGKAAAKKVQRGGVVNEYYY